MSKQKWTEDKIRKMEAEGRGKGSGANYQPWIEATDFSSKGNIRREFSPKTQRVHHLLSDVEWKLFTLLEYSPVVLDIREQFPLERADTLSVAAQRGIKHPTYPGTDIATVMTCDFLVVLTRNGDRTLAAFSCKADNGLEARRKLELQELERACLASMDIPHYLVVPSALPETKIRNLYWCRNADIADDGQHQEMHEEHCARMLNELRDTNRSSTLAEYCRHFDTRLGASPGTGLRVARALIWRRQLTTDLHQQNLPDQPLAMFRVPRLEGACGNGG